MRAKRAMALLLEAALMAALAAAAGLCGLTLGGRVLTVVRAVLIWAVSGPAAAALALLAARQGIPAILAWPAGPAAWTACYAIVVGMTPPGGGLLWIVLCAVVGASAGEVLLSRGKDGRRTR